MVRSICFLIATIAETLLYLLMGPHNKALFEQSVGRSKYVS